MNLHYLSISRLPSDEANSVHVMRMCAALARAGHDVTLHAHRPAGGRARVDRDVRGDLDGGAHRELASELGGTLDRDLDDAAVFAHYDVAANFRLLRHPVDAGGPVRRALHRVVVGDGPRAVRGLAKRILDRRTVRPMLASGAVDLVYARNSVALLAADVHEPFVFESHTPASGRVGRFLERRVLARPGLARIVVISEALAAVYRSRYPEHADKVIVAHDAADDPLPGEPAPAGPAHRSGAGGDAPDRALHVGHVGHLYPGRGGPTIAAMAARASWAHFDVVGGRANDVDALRSKLTSGNVTLHGHVPPRELAGFYRRFDVVIAPYERTIGTSGRTADISAYLSPMKLFEYMSWGLPIVCADLPVLREVLTDGETALLVAPDDVGGWVEALTRLRDDPALAARLGAQARKVFLERHTWDARARTVLDGLARADGAEAGP